MRKKLTFHISDLELFKEKLLFWSKQYQYVSILDSNQVDQKINSKKEYNSKEFLAAVDVVEYIQPQNNSFQQLQEALENKQDWWFGYLSYDLKNEIEDLDSENFDGLQFPNLHFFRPQWVFEIEKNDLTIHYTEGFSVDKIKEIYQQICSCELPIEQPITIHSIQARINRDEYLDSIRSLKQHIRRGDIYEINFCQEFFAENVQLQPRQTYRKLKEISPTPYACFYSMPNQYLMCASPERFMKKKGNQLISQPIKGTAKRGKTKEEDEQIKKQLYTDPKERAENIMIVDLVRNDLSHSAVKGSVRVEELCGIYTFPQVHQMISTILSDLREDIHPVEAIRQCFPMGSMTGAPKISAMKLSEKYESSKRGLFSGAVGYFTPEGDFDFNVVIRSLQYNKQNRYLSFMVGGAITMQCEPEREYEECLLKAKAIMKVLNQAEKA
jgi:para-aminobenzoate synthetase component 1